MLKKRFPGLATALVVIGLATSGQAAEVADVRNLMTPDEFEAAGLGKLDAGEIEALNRWLIRYTAREAPTVRRSEAVRDEIRKIEGESVRSRIDGPFAGWNGRTVFRLQNGQVWRQRIEGQWLHRAESPEVIVEKNIMGFWMLKVLPEGRAVGVSRIR